MAVKRYTYLDAIIDSIAALNSKKTYKTVNKLCQLRDYLIRETLRTKETYVQSKTIK